MIGQTVSHYKILEKLGEGGMGVVYKAQDLRLDRIVALKFLPPHLGAEEDQKKRFFQEAKAASALDHPNICTIHEIDQTERGQIFICMAYYEGEPLNKKIEKGPLKTEETISISLQIAQGLAKAHRQGIVHRDIKSGNVVITADGIAKIVDFGLAKLLGNSTSAKSKTVGTPNYIAPELLRGEAADHRADLWSLGVVLYEMLTGQKPFTGEYEQAVMYAILNEIPAPLSSMRKEVPFQLENVVAKCLQKDPAGRYQKAEELIADLKQAEAACCAAVPAASVLKSIAVLPFDNISPDPENEYFSDGLTEEVITHLSKIRTLKVISRTSAVRYKGVKKPLRQIAGELGVEFILEGSVRRQGNDLRITAQLIDAVQDSHLWAEKYRGTMEDVFDIQEKVAGEITGALRLTLSPNEEKDLKQRPTQDPEAFQSYLKGRYWWNKRTEESIWKGIRFFEQAIQKDPLYALAYAGLADSYNMLGFYSMLPPKEAFPKARAAALKSLEIDENLAEAYPALAYARHYHDWNWSGAEKDYQRALQLNPNYASANQFYGTFLLSMGRTEEGFARMRKALELDPLSLIINAALGWLHYYARQYDLAIEQFKKVLEMDPNFFLAHLWMGFAYQEKAMYGKALEEYEKAKAISSGSPITIASLGHTYATSGEREKALAMVEELLELQKKRYVSAYYFASIYAGLGDKDTAFDWFEKAFEERSQALVFLKVDPHVDPLRDDLRFTALLRKVGLEK
ncbi:MAG TPA: protein kinase [Verrucomicrobiae bacterium]|nr:protein kinase [Verrucomicrobiae bacterium]